MKCPVCPDSALLMSDRQGLEIDHCPQCRGVWLDRGELDKLIARSAARSPAASDDDDGGDDDDEDGQGTRLGGRKKSWLGKFFD